MQACRDGGRKDGRRQWLRIFAAAARVVAFSAKRIAVSAPPRRAPSRQRRHRRHDGAIEKIAAATRSAAQAISMRRHIENGTIII